jgi:hypothetical protein
MRRGTQRDEQGGEELWPRQEPIILSLFDALFFQKMIVFTSDTFVFGVQVSTLVKKNQRRSIPHREARFVMVPLHCCCAKLMLVANPKEEKNY